MSKEGRDEIIKRIRENTEIVRKTELITEYEILQKSIKNPKLNIVEDYFHMIEGEKDA